MSDRFGESITIRDFSGKMTDTVRIRADGSFIDGYGKIIPTDQLGRYVLESCYHPARSHQAKPVVPIPNADLNTTGPVDDRYTTSNSQGGGNHITIS